MPGLNLVIVSGLSGSGKSHALKCFEDTGYFCVDNLPPALLPTFVELCTQQSGEIKNVALGIDIRERVFFGDLVGTLERLKTSGHSVHLVFLEAREEILGDPSPTAFGKSGWPELVEPIHRHIARNRLAVDLPGAIRWHGEPRCFDHRTA